MNFGLLIRWLLTLKSGPVGSFGDLDYLKNVTTNCNVSAIVDM